MTPSSGQPPAVALPDLSGTATSLSGRGKPSHSTIIIATWLATRLLMVAALMLTMHQRNWTAGQALANWDVAHFMSIASTGYANTSEVAFFPVIPAIMAVLGALGIPMAIGGALVSWIASLVAAFAMQRLGGIHAAVIWLLVPMAVFTTVGYTEAVFCALAFWAWVLARQGRWAWVAALASVACLTRVSGLFLVGGLGLLALFGGEPTPPGTTPAKKTAAGNGAGRNQAGWRERLMHCVWLVIPLLVVFGYAAYLHSITGAWDSWYSAQREEWGRAWTSPFTSLENTVNAVTRYSAGSEPSMGVMFAFEIAAMAIGLTTSIGCLVRKAWAQAGYVLVQVFAFSITTWFMSVNRAILLWFPLFIGVGTWFSFRPRAAAGRATKVALVAVLVGADLILMFWWAWLFYNGKWAS
jgi:hypothetical protein